MDKPTYTFTATGSTTTNTFGYWDGQHIIDYGQIKIVGDESVKIRQLEAQVASLQSQLFNLSKLSNSSMFALACIVLGLDTPEQRRLFKFEFDMMNADWSDEFKYEWLIQKAYEIKYGSDSN